MGIYSQNVINSSQLPIVNIDKSSKTILEQRNPGKGFNISAIGGTNIENIKTILKRTDDSNSYSVHANITYDATTQTPDFAAFAIPNYESNNYYIGMNFGNGWDFDYIPSGSYDFLFCINK